VKITVIFILILLYPFQISAKREHPEKWYQERWCKENNGQAEVVLPWAEAVGQSSYYSIQTKKRAGVVLILENKKDRKYWMRLNTTVEHFDLPIDIWNVGNAAY
jgi:hypothetical protein